MDNIHHHVDARAPTLPAPRFQDTNAAYPYPDDFQARSADELSLTKGDRVELIERDDEFGDGWFLGKHLLNGGTGLFPEGKSHHNAFSRWSGWRIMD